MPHRPDDSPLRWSAASRLVVEQLQAALGFEWVGVTRKRGREMVLLQVQDEAYGVGTGAVLPWDDSFCARAGDGRAPRLVPDVRSAPAHAEAARLLGMPVGSLVSVPLRGDSGEVIGSLCALSPRVHDDALHAHAPLVETYAKVLGALLTAELQLQPVVRRGEVAADETDPVSGLGNRRTWERRLAAEERRCAAYGLDAGLLAVAVRPSPDVAGSGDELHVRAVATALREVAGPDAVLARVGAARYAVLLPEADAARLEAVTADLRRALAVRRVPAGTGATRRAADGAIAAWHRADELSAVDLAAVALGAALADEDVVAALPGAAVPAPDAPGEVLVRELLDLARRQLGASIAFVGQWEGDVRVMRGVSSAVPLGIGRGSTERLDATYCQRIVDGRLPRVIADTSRYAAALELPVTQAVGIGSYVGVPVLLSDGSLYGTLCCLSPEPDPDLSDRDADFLSAIAASMARVLEMELSALRTQAALVARLDPLLRGERTAMVFQPVVSLVDGRLVGAEALARFGGEPKPVDEWFADAESAGLTGELELATARAALLAGAELPGFLAVNLSATTICSPGFAALLAGVDPARLVVEVSEHEQINDYEAVLAVLAPLRARGLRLAVDDAGAGFASLRHVVMLAPDIIKLDISLVRDIDRDPTRQALATALTSFAHQTGAQVIAEGVETEAQRAVLRQAGVGLMQGWLESGGVSPEQFIARWGRRPAVPQPRRTATDAP